MQPTDVQFRGEDGVTVRGRLYLPDCQYPCPAISMAHGFAATIDHGLAQFARVFTNGGFAVLMHDHRGFGNSEGEPRADIDPWRQIADWRHAVSFLETHPAVDRTRIGLWGTSFAGGHVLVLGATDPRIKAVVSQVPTISGFEQSQRRVPPDHVAQHDQRFVTDDRRHQAGHPPATQLVVHTDDSRTAVYGSREARDFYLQVLPEATAWENTVTLRSTRAASMYEPGQWASRVSPTPLLMVVALEDAVTLTDTALRAYEQALQPKALVTYPGGHFGAYAEHFDIASSAALNWFTTHLT
ncbi:alpha/beta hydrolase [Mycolicibacterium conceptionense]|uniref:alpha/beta hydrolase n=1 Tax=Mycolicibacterium conceptionense TaxID=451644 RepID=UPI00096E52C3|nr:alpha/beta fold hydrolase [Mycolicibacterium conceptionense]OMB79432.1 peptidase S15 [Mycolicibacterium conceptionense]